MLESGVVRFLITVILILLIPFSVISSEISKMKVEKMRLPKIIDAWSLGESPKIINAANIFDYMNGAGELYLGYNFDYLLVYDYKNNNDNNILVELYYMKSSHDAFGLLSLDWSGQTVWLNNSPELDSDVIPSSKALYGQGLLRVWSGNLYVRILAVRETPRVKNIILKLGKIITANRKSKSPPEMLKILVPAFGSDWILNKQRVGYFYSYLVLNSLFYLSHENILNLDHSTEAIMAPFEKKDREKILSRVHLLVIKYSDDKQATRSLADFIKAFLPEQKREKTSALIKQNVKFYRLEEGWLGCKLHDRYLVLVFGCPDLNSAEEIINSIL